MLRHLRPRSGSIMLLLGLAFVTAARAQVTFTITATANADSATTSNGYVANSSYTFTFTTPASYPDNPDSVFSAAGQTALWTDEVTTTDANLFAAIAGSGLAGTYVRPTTTSTSPFATVETIGGALTLTADSDDPAPRSIGLTSLSATGLGSIVVHVSNTAAFSQGNSYLEPAAYFGPYAGTYASATGTVVLLDGNAQNAGDFTVTGLTISAVPEPATTAVLTGLAGLGAGLIARRRRSAA